MAGSFDINSKEIEVFRRLLERTGKYDLPIVARQTINSAAVGVKKRTLPRVFKQKFTNRKKTFIKANSKFETSRSSDLNNMIATVGVIKKGKGQKSDQAVRDLRFQERGGLIKGRSFVPIDKGSRIGGKNARNVRKPFRINALSNKLVHSKRNKGKSSKERFVRSAIHAFKTHGAGKGFVLSEKNSQGKQFVWRIDKVNKSSKNRKTFIKQEAIYSFDKGRNVRIKGRRFLTLAATERAKFMRKDFVKHARKRLKI